MSEKCFIYWRKDRAKKFGETFAHVHLLVGYNQGTIADFQAMVTKLRKTFPEAPNDQIYCGKITTSRFYKGFSIVSWNAYIPEGDYLGWDQITGGNMEYFWQGSQPTTPRIKTGDLNPRLVRGFLF